MKQISPLKPIFFGLACGAMVLAYCATAVAQTVFVQQPLSFGRFAVKTNGDGVLIAIQPSGNVVTNTSTYIIDEPQRGEYILQNAPANTSYSITVPEVVNLSGHDGHLILDNIRVSPATLRTNDLGESHFTLSGRLRSVEGRERYRDGNYSNDLSLLLNF